MENSKEKNYVGFFDYFRKRYYWNFYEITGWTDKKFVFSHWCTEKKAYEISSTNELLFEITF